MDILTQAFSEIRADLPWNHIFVGLSVILMGQLLLKVLDWFFHRAFLDGNKDQRRALSFRKAFVYGFNFLLFILFLKIIQVDMKVILGATGLLTIAIGFAARTPISNLISGIFLVFERPFVVGNIIEVGGYTGEVVSRNLLSLTLRTLDNLMVRIPNEIVIGSSVSNVSFFPIRRLEIKYLLSNKDSLTRLEEIFKDVASRNGLALNEPEPFFYVNEFKENHSEVIFKVWCPSDDYFTFLSEFPKEIHRAVKAAGMERITQNIHFVDAIRIEKEMDRQ